MMGETEVKNAVIRNARILIEDHGFLTAFIDLDYGSTGQGFGGYVLHSAHPSALQHNYAGVFIRRCLEIADVDDWARLPGKTVRVRASHCKVEAIGNIIRDSWFNPSEEFEKLKGNA